MSNEENSNYKFRAAVSRKDIRRAEADKRREERDRLTPQQQLKVLDSRPGKAARERSRLIKQAKS